MTFPLRYEVTWYPYDPTGAKDELGNEQPTWGEGVQRKVVGWVPGSAMQYGEYQGREVIDVLLLVPPNFAYTKQDRVDLPDNTDNLYWVTGGDDYSHTSPFTAWKPGSTIKLRLVEG